MSIEGLRFDPTINIGSIIVLATVIFGVLKFWLKDRARLIELERWREEHQKITDESMPVLKQLAEALTLLNQRLKDYPLHKHINDKIVFPG